MATSTQDTTTFEGFIAALNERDGVRATATDDAGAFQVVVADDKTGFSIDFEGTGPATFTRVSHTTDGVRYDGVFEE